MACSDNNLYTTWKNSLEEVFQSGVNAVQSTQTPMGLDAVSETGIQPSQDNVASSQENAA